MVQNRVGEIRRKRQIPAAALAQSTGVSRQTIYAIEDGSFVPNTAVALRLARALGVTVEELFIDTGDAGTAPAARGEAVVLTADEKPASPGQFLYICRVGNRRVAVPVTTTDFLPPANAVLEQQRGNRADIRFQPDVEDSHVLVAGCDPALTLVSDCSPIVLNCGSRRALELLKHRMIHVAGCHVRDAVSGDYNTPLIRSMFRKGEVRALTFATWEQGLIVAPANPKRIRSISDLARKGVRLVTREAGAASRDLLEREVRTAGLDAGAVMQRATVAYGHLAAAEQVYSDVADCCVGSRAAAQFYRLEFIPLQQDRFDLVIRKESLPLAPVKMLLDAISTLRFRQRLALFAGYETSHTGDSVM